MSAMRERLEKASWRKVTAPKNWYPKFNGEDLVGYYGGRTVKNGKFGQYEVVMVHVPSRGSFLVSGTRLIQLIDSACVSRGDPIRIVWGGYKTLSPDEHTGEERRMKLFEVFVEGGERMSDEDLPSMGGFT